MGHVPRRLPTVYFFSGHFRAAQTLILDSLWLPIRKEYTGIYCSFVAVYCKNFIMFLCVTLKLFFLSFVPLLSSDPGDATVATSCQIRRSCTYHLNTMFGVGRRALYLNCVSESLNQPSYQYSI